MQRYDLEPRWDEPNNRAGRRHRYDLDYDYHGERGAGSWPPVRRPRGRRPRAHRSRHDVRFHRPRRRFELVVEEVVLAPEWAVETA
jgi:hypothetical protein